MAFPRKRRPRRAYTWHGHVTEVYPDIVGTIIVAVGHEMHDLYAEFDRAQFDDDVQAGTIFRLYVHRRGKKTRTVLRTVRRTWTAEEIAAIEARAAKRFDDLSWLIEMEPTR